MPDTPSFKPTQNESSSSPLRMMADILKDKTLTKEDKDYLHQLASTRFYHRRVIAYISLFAMIGGAIFGLIKCPDNVTLILALISPFTTIVLAYIGFSSARPNS